MLVLFDIDGTLLHGRPEGHAHAMVAAIQEVWDVEVGPDDVWATQPAGRTDREIARLVLRGQAVGDARIDMLMADWIVRAAEIHAETSADHPAPVAARDADAVAGRLVDEGAELALVTGNLQPIGRAKVSAVGLGHHFGEGGGFGCDSEVRADLVRLAMQRAARAHGRDDVVVVGDTPRDVAAAREAGVRVIAVTTGAHDTAALQTADAVAPDLTGALAVLLA